MITVILSTINSLSLNYPVSSRSRTLLLVLSLELPNCVISLPSYALFTGSGSPNAPNAKFSQLPNLHIFKPHLRSTSSQYSLFIHRHSCSATIIILSKNNITLLLFCFTLSLESIRSISLLTTFWYQFLHF